MWILVLVSVLGLALFAFWVGHHARNVFGGPKSDKPTLLPPGRGGGLSGR